KKFAAEVNNKNNLTYKDMFDNDLITLNRWRELMGEEKSPDGDVFKSQLVQTDQPLAVALGAEGTQAMMTIVTDTVLQPEEKRNALMLLCKLNQATVNKLVVDKPEKEKEDEPPQPPNPGEEDDDEPKLKINLG